MMRARLPFPFKGGSADRIRECAAPRRAAPSVTIESNPVANLLRKLRCTRKPFASTAKKISTLLCIETSFKEHVVGRESQSRLRP